MLLLHLKTDTHFVMNFFSVFRYATLVWLTGLLGLPTLFVLYSTIYWGGSIRNSLYAERWDLVGPVFALTPWTIPNWLIFIWATHTVCKRTWSKWKKKLVLFYMGFMFLVLTNALYCFLNNSSEFFDSSYILLLYWLPGFLGIFIYRLPKADVRRV